MRRYAGGKVDWLASGLPSEGYATAEPRIAALAVADVPTCGVDQRIGDVRRAYGRAVDLCVVVNAERVVLGDLRGDRLRQAADDALVNEMMHPNPSTYRPNVSVHEMARHLANGRATRVLVTDGDGRLIGLLQRADVERAVLNGVGGPLLADPQRVSVG